MVIILILFIVVGLKLLNNYRVWRINYRLIFKVSEIWIRVRRVISLYM